MTCPTCYVLHERASENAREMRSVAGGNGGNDMKPDSPERFRPRHLWLPALLIAVAHFGSCYVLIGAAFAPAWSSGLLVPQAVLGLMVLVLSLGLVAAGPMGLVLSSLAYGVGGALLWRVFVPPSSGAAGSGHTLPRSCARCGSDMRGHFDQSTGRTACPGCGVSYFGKPYEPPAGFCDYCGYDIRASHDPEAGRTDCPECGTPYHGQAWDDARVDH